MAAVTGCLIVLAFTYNFEWHLKWQALPYAHTNKGLNAPPSLHTMDERGQGCRTPEAAGFTNCPENTKFKVMCMEVTVTFKQVVLLVFLVNGICGKQNRKWSNYSH